MKKITLFALLLSLFAGSLQAQEVLVSKLWFLDSLNLDGTNIPVPTEIVPFGDPELAYPAGDINLEFNPASGGNFIFESYGMFTNVEFTTTVGTADFESVMTETITMSSSTTEDWIVDDFKSSYFNNFVKMGLFFSGGASYTITGNKLTISSGTDYAVYHYVCDIESPTGATAQTLEAGETLADLSVTASGDAELIWYADAALTEPLDDTTIAVTGTTYFVAQTDGACTSAALAIAVTVNPPLGLTTINPTYLKVYPNPVQETLTISIDAAYSVKSSVVTVVDILGKVVRTFEMNQQKQTFNLGTLPTGTYILKYTGEQHSFTQKLIVE